MSESEKSQTYYITTPIYYVNDKPHIGHAYTTILGDVLARFHRQMGRETFFLTGTDEHGLKVQQAAEARGVAPQQHVDETVVRFQELWKKLEITHDDFIRTTQPNHVKVVQDILQDLYDRGEIYKAEYDGWYCVGCERYYTEKDLVEGNCPECGKPVDQISEANYFFRMSSYQDWLIKYIKEHPDFIQPAFRANETLGFLKKPLQDLCISRPKSRLAWGIEIPFDRDYVTYVWFDALVNYITGVGYRQEAVRFGKWWPVNCHLIGKDILTTHTVYWPTMLKAMGQEMPKTIFAHGWWLQGERKMSKSDGNVVDPMEMIERYGVDATRYYLMAEMTLGQDSSFTEESFIRRYNSDLANDLGNLLSRVLNMVNRFCGGTIPAASDAIMKGEEEAALKALAEETGREVFDLVDGMKMDQALIRAMTLVRAVNRYLEVRKPWVLAKQDAEEELHTVLYCAAEALRSAATLFKAVMPGKIASLLKALGADCPDDVFWGGLKAGVAVETSMNLFPRIDQEQKVQQKDKSEEVKAKTSPSKEEKPKAEAGLVSLDDFKKIELRTAKVLEAEPVEGADKLLKLEVLMGDQRRQLVAGVALHYKPEDLIGRTVVIVANLKPAKIRGVESQGMILCAAKGETLRLVTVEGELSSGAEVR